MIYFTSDLHFYHQRILEHCQRPFLNVEEMNQAIIENWNARVKKKDEIYILGDVTMQGHKRAEEMLGQLNGKKYLILGNHDEFAHKDSFDFESVGIRWIKDYFELLDHGDCFVLSHFPFLSWHWIKKGAYMLHGHMHSPASYNQKNQAMGLRRYDVGVDANDFRPISIDEIRNYFPKEFVTKEEE